MHPDSGDRGFPKDSLCWTSLLFEVLQNAQGVGPHADNSSVSVCLDSKRTVISFETDGARPMSRELSALLSGGGSNKDYESKDMTGCFGTGFLVTHVSAERTTPRELLATPSGFEQFHLLLGYGGDEEAIPQNMGDWRETIRTASHMSALNVVESARFEYPIDDNNSLALEKTRSKLGSFHQTVFAPMRKSSSRNTGAVWSLRGVGL